MTRVVCIGECMVELTHLHHDQYTRSFAGDAFNTAVHLKRLAPQSLVQFVTVTGADHLSAAMRGAWRRRGIDEALAFTAPGLAPGLYMVDVDEGGERSFTYWRGQSAARRWLSALLAHGGVEALAGADLVYLSGVSLAILAPRERRLALELLADLKLRVGSIAFDPNVRQGLWGSAAAMRGAAEAAIACASIALPSLDDCEQLWGGRDADTHVRRILALGVEEVALTLATEGCVVAQAGRPVIRLPALSDVAVDTSGAGDAFNGAYLAARLLGQSPEEAGRAGLVLAGHTVGYRGALAPIAEELQ